MVKSNVLFNKLSVTRLGKILETLVNLSINSKSEEKLTLGRKT